ncbi:MAG: cyclic nucleotide-binding domain-containing protein [Acidovorax sp.]|uniref:Crp/Fnr family transcriptional regulator n=1 Tax=Acidovorax sp. TaxID=1872122 RepID=UPI0039E22BED
MNVPLSTVSPKVDLQGLINAIAQASADDSMINPLSAAQWDVLSPYLLPVVMPAGQVLFTQGSTDRTLYLVESGSLSVHFQDDKERLRLAIVGPGSVVGEGAFFSHRARSATVQASAPSKLWSLPALRFTELSNRQPAIALGLAMAAGSVLAKRLGNRRRRVAAT